MVFNMAGGKLILSKVKSLLTGLNPLFLRPYQKKTAFAKASAIKRGTSSVGQSVPMQSGRSESQHNILGELAQLARAFAWHATVF